MNQGQTVGPQNAGQIALDSQGIARFALGLEKFLSCLGWSPANVRKVSTGSQTHLSRGCRNKCGVDFNFIFLSSGARIGEYMRMWRDQTKPAPGAPKVLCPLRSSKIPSLPRTSDSADLSHCIAYRGSVPSRPDDLHGQAQLTWWPMWPYVEPSRSV